MFKSKIGLVLSTAALVAACSGNRGENVAANNQQSQGNHKAGATHWTPTVQQAQAARNAAGPNGQQLNYYGGKVIQDAKIYNIYWGNAGSYQAQLDQFTQQIMPSSYFAWLSEYDTSSPAQTIVPGTFVQSIVDSNAPAGTSITDAQIQAELVSLITAGTLPPPDGNNLYMFFFPNGVNVSTSFGASCSSFCGYHDTFMNGSQELYYGVLPDPATCGSSCDNQNGNYFADLTSVTTHELTEAITDPEVGIAILNSQQPGGTYPTFPNAWDDPSFGEIGDICAWQNATVLGYNVQLEWSNAQGACVASGGTQTNDFSLAASPSSATVQAGSSTQFTVTATLTAGSAENLTLSVSGLPAGVTGSFNPASMTSNGGSSVLTLTAAPNAQSSTSSVSITASGSATHSAQVSLTVTGGTSSNLLGNGDFETGDLTDWTVAKGVVAASSAVVHGGSYSALLGSNVRGYSGNDVLTQSVTVPSTGTTTLSFWGNYVCPGANTFEYERVWILNSTNHRLAQVYKQCDNNQTWENTTFDLTPYAGQTITLQFLNRDDKSSADLAYWYLDDVSVTNQ